jgi:hypothetical protein
MSAKPGLSGATLLAVHAVRPAVSCEVLGPLPSESSSSCSWSPVVAAVVV